MGNYDYQSELLNSIRKRDRGYYTQEETVLKYYDSYHVGSDLPKFLNRRGAESRVEELCDLMDSFVD